MNILVTGACGFIGSHLVEKLNNLLLALSNKYKKEAIISIHPHYDLKKHQKD